MVIDKSEKINLLITMDWKRTLIKKMMIEIKKISLIHDDH